MLLRCPQSSPGVFDNCFYVLLLCALLCASIASSINNAEAHTPEYNHGTVTSRWLATEQFARVSLVWRAGMINSCQPGSWIPSHHRYRFRSVLQLPFAQWPSAHAGGCAWFVRSGLVLPFIARFKSARVQSLDGIFSFHSHSVVQREKDFL